MVVDVGRYVFQTRVRFPSSLDNENNNLSISGFTAMYSPFFLSKSMFDMTKSQIFLLSLKSRFQLLLKNRVEGSFSEMSDFVFEILTI